ncbi:hypothetical protein [Bacillus sp. AY2-1]|uniref:hypothetical protein n=1 Tax=Bacillus sp. AY2-1 TaxID=2217828 RepID=UPI0015D3D189|nr:hypothetical protein [Bacillus sp. AY2-1]
MIVGNIVVILVNVRIIVTGGNTNRIMILVSVNTIAIGGNINRIIILVNANVDNVNVLFFVVIVIANIGKIVYIFDEKFKERLVLYIKGQVFFICYR